MDTRLGSTAYQCLGAAILLTCCAAIASGNFELVENFNDLALGSIDEQGTWNVSGLGGEVIADVGANQVLEVTVDTGVLTRQLTVPNDQTRMLFMRFRFDGQHNYSFGLSPLSNPTEYSDFGPELRRNSALDRLEVHDGQRYQMLTTLEPLTWYNVWALVNNDAGNTEVWLHSRPGESADAGDQLAADGQTAFDFRMDANRDLIRFYIKAADGGSGRDPLWIDDIYLENSSAVNLTNPAAPIPGDFNCDSIVDGEDFLVWQRGESLEPLNSSELADWQANFGTAPAQLATMTTIPEPSSCFGWVLTTAAMLLNRRRRAGFERKPSG